MQAIFYKFFKTLGNCFRGTNALWHLLAAVITYTLVISGFDWFYFSLRNSFVYPLLFPATIIGAFLPIFLPLGIYIYGKTKKCVEMVNSALAVGQAGLMAWFISSSYKFFTGRIQPPHFLTASTADISKVFRFGLYRGGVFWGWPSSHTTVAFACATTLAILYPKNKLIKVLAVAYAFYIGIGVSISIHWFSDFVAGAIMGTVIGIAVGRSFLERYKIHN